MSPPGFQPGSGNPRPLFLFHEDVNLKPLLIAFAALGAASAFANRLVVVVDGKPVKFPENAQPMVYKGRVMVPMRGIFEALGATLTYDPTTRKVEAQRNNEGVELTFGSKIAKKNGAEILLDTPPSIIHNVTYVPMRFIAESLGAKLAYDKANMRLEIVTDPAPKGGGADPGVTGGPDPDPLPLERGETVPVSRLSNPALRP